jgi:8-oxo-dGTP pyrophosphatase MutT (NUDIX family)
MLVPTLGVAVAVCAGDQLLLTLREDFKVWCLPGGSVEDGESVAEAAIREVREETGLDVQLLRMVGVYSRPHWVAGGVHTIVFEARPLQRIGAPDICEVVEVRYFDSGELPERILWWHRQYVYDALSGFAGSVVRSIPVIWPFAQDMTRAELYGLRDRGELSEDIREQLWCPPPGWVYEPPNSPA